MKTKNKLWKRPFAHGKDTSSDNFAKAYGFDTFKEFKAEIDKRIADNDVVSCSIIRGPDGEFVMRNDLTGEII